MIKQWNWWSNLWKSTQKRKDKEENINEKYQEIEECAIQNKRFIPESEISLKSSSQQMTTLKMKNANYYVMAIKFVKDGKISAQSSTKVTTIQSQQ